MKLRLLVVFALLIIPITGCQRRTPPVAAPPPQVVVDDSAARARADSIAAAELARRQLAETEAARRAQMARAQELLTTVVFFDYDSSDLSTETEDRLRGKATLLRANPSLEIRIEGHADERGSTEYNLALGQRRAESVRTFISGYGIDPNRLATISYGKERPAVPGSTETAYARNRRAEFAVTAGEISAIPQEIF